MMSWDGDWWGIRTARAEHLDGLSQWAKDNTVGLIYLLIDSEDTEQLHCAEESGYRVMDTRITLSRPTSPRMSFARLHREEDVARLCDIARHAFRHTRFYADTELDRGSVDALYEEWVRSACAGEADTVLVFSVDKVPVGFVTVHLEPARIGLIAVADDYRGNGIGAELTDAAIDYVHAYNPGEIRVATQVANIGALRTFESCGFRVCESAYWLHKHYEAL